MAGFKFKSFSFVGQSTDFPPGTTDDLIRQREELICKGVAQAIIDTNTGWQLDTDRSATITSFANVPTVGSTTKFAPGLFLENSSSHNKLFVCYCGNPISRGIDLSEDQVTTLYHADHLNEITKLTGLCMSMIPGDSNQSFGANFDSEFIPSSGTRLAADCISYGGNTSNLTISYLNASGVTYTYDLFTTPYCIFFRVQGVLGYAVGRVLGNLAHSTVDTSSQSKYGVIYFKRCTGNETDTTLLMSNTHVTQSSASSTYYGTSFLGSSPTNAASSSDNPFNSKINYSSSSATNANPYLCWAGSSSVCKADGTWLGNTSERAVCYYPDNPALVRNSGITSNTGSTKRWVPYICFIKSSNLENHGIIPGDGIKGYLDTNLFRYNAGSVGTLLDNGNFYILYSHLTIGWDPSNELPNP